MELPGDCEAMEVVARRIDFLEYLRDEPADKAAMVEALDHSRSTVDRAIAALEEEGFVERVDDGFVTSQIGRLAADRYRALLADERAILAAGDVLGGLPRDLDLPPSIVPDPGDDPDRLDDLVADRLRAADRYRALLPDAADPRHLRWCHTAAVDGNCEVELLASPDLLERLREAAPRRARDLAAADGFVARAVDDPGFGLLLFAASGTGGSAAADPAAGTSVVLVGYADGEVDGFLHADGADAIDWAVSTLEGYREDGTDATAVFEAASGE